MVHLKVAQNILKGNKKIKDIGAFYMGSLTPDAIMFRQGCQRSEKSHTHFCIGDEGWGYYTNFIEWEENLKLKISSYAGKVNPDFLFGYYVHIITDINHSRKFWTPIRLTEDKKIIDDYFKDCYEIDSYILESLESKELIWSLLREAKNYHFSDLCLAEDISLLVNEMTDKMYNDRKPNPDYKFKVIALSDMFELIDRVVSNIIEAKYQDNLL